MTYPGNFLRLVASGTLHQVESFSWSLSLVPDFPSDDGAGPATVPAAIATAVSVFHQAVSSSAAKLTTLKLNLIGPNGRYVNEESSVVHDYGNPGITATSQPIYPPQVALAVSLRSDASRGLAHAGRFYIPSPHTGMEPDGRMNVGSAEGVATAARTMLSAINAGLDGWVVGIASDTREGEFRPVTSVRVGRVYDTIRSRRTSLAEDYVTSAAIA